MTPNEETKYCKYCARYDECDFRDTTTSKFKAIVRSPNETRRGLAYEDFKALQEKEGKDFPEICGLFERI